MQALLTICVSTYACEVRSVAHEWVLLLHACLIFAQRQENVQQVLSNARSDGNWKSTCTPPNCHCDIGTNRTLYREPHRIAIGVKANVHSTELELQSAQKQPNPYQTTNWHRRQTSRTIVSACTTAGQIFTNITLTTLTRKGASSQTWL